MHARPPQRRWRPCNRSGACGDWQRSTATPSSTIAPVDRRWNCVKVSTRDWCGPTSKSREGGSEILWGADSELYVGRDVGGRDVWTLGGRGPDSQGRRFADV